MHWAPLSLCGNIWGCSSHLFSCFFQRPTRTTQGSTWKTQTEMWIKTIAEEGNHFRARKQNMASWNIVKPLVVTFRVNPSASLGMPTSCILTFNSSRQVSVWTTTGLLRSDFRKGFLGSDGPQQAMEPVYCWQLRAFLAPRFQSVRWMGGGGRHSGKSISRLVEMYCNSFCSILDEFQFASGVNRPSLHVWHRHSFCTWRLWLDQPVM